MDTTEEDDQAVPLESLEDEQMSFDGASLMLSVDGRSSSEVLYGDLPSSSRSSLEHSHAEDGSGCSTDGSSPLGWPLQSNRADKCHSVRGGGARMAFPGIKSVFGSISTAWDVQRSIELSEADIMKEKFAKLLLGEDMSGGGKGVCSALAISNAITNLSASIFGELWRLEPLADERKKIWKREMDWLLSVADHIVELVPSSQTFPDGSHFEVMISRPRSDLHANLPALRKLDAMLLESLDNFSKTEFWYVDQGISVNDADGQSTPPLQRQEDKWWLPKSKVPLNGLSDDSKKRLQHQRECLSQILKAAMAINSQVLSEIEIPDVYWDALPKNGKASLGDTIYRCITSEYFSPEALLCSLDLSSEHKAVEVANRIEAAIRMWRRKGQPRSSPKSGKEFKHKNSWGILKDFVSDADRREFLAGRAESLLLCLKQKIPGLRQSLLDMTKIQHNKDVGQSILESYSRVLESLAYNIIARIDDVLYVDDMTRRAMPPNSPAVNSCSASSQRCSFSSNLSMHSQCTKPFTSHQYQADSNPNTK